MLVEASEVVQRDDANRHPVCIGENGHLRQRQGAEADWNMFREFFFFLMSCDEDVHRRMHKCMAMAILAPTIASGEASEPSIQKA